MEMDAKAVEQFLSYCTRSTIPKKHLIVREGDPADTLYYLIEGSATVLMEDKEDPGHEIILAYLNQGEFIGELGLFFRTSSRSTMVRARSECVLAAIKYDDLSHLFQNELKDIHAQIMTSVGRQLAQRLLSTSRKVGQLAFLDVTGRVARTLIEMCEAPEAMSHPDGTQIHISRQEIARNVGCSREMAGRVLRSLADQGMIRARGMDIVVLHPR
jgi:CRP/FNR family cyclic AMP-dependent transcriptional regulator